MSGAIRQKWTVDEGEEARLAPDASSAEIRSVGYLPLRTRTEARHHASPGFPGTAVVLGSATYEVIAETSASDSQSVVYSLRAWPEGEVTRDRVVYGLAFIRRAQADRKSLRRRERARPFRFILYPLAGLLPEDEQVRVCDRYGLDAVVATLVSGLCEGMGVLWLLATVIRNSGKGEAVMLLLALPGLVLLVLPGFGRAFGAAFLRETGGSGPVVLAFDLLRQLGAMRRRVDAGFVPLTRAAFWDRLSRPDSIERTPAGGFLVRGLLAHLTWTVSHRLRSGNDYWRTSPELPELRQGRLVYSYRLEPADRPRPDGPHLPGRTASEDTVAPQPPDPLAYADEVLGGVRLEWDAFNQGFAWLTTLLSADKQARAFDHRGGPPAARRPTIATVAAAAILGLYLLNELRGGPAADPLAPFVALFAAVLLIDAVGRLVAARGGRYAPSLFRCLLPADMLRPERVAYHAHRDAERAALDRLRKQ